MDKDVESLLTYLSTNFPWKDDVTRYEHLALYEALVNQIVGKFRSLAKKDTQQSLRNKDFYHNKGSHYCFFAGGYIYCDMAFLLER